jgi:uncharacterized glyoxalase superfamily protein PhnB
MLIPTLVCTDAAAEIEFCKRAFDARELSRRTGDTVISRAVGAGATVLLPAADQAWGDRVGRIIDSAGHVWNIAAPRI